MIPVQIPPGGNKPLDGRRVVVEFAATSLGGARFVAEDGGEPKVVDGAEQSVSLAASGAQVRAEIDLSILPVTISRLRLVAWSEQGTRTLAPADARISVDGEHRFTIAIEAGRMALGSAEVLEVYRRHGAWKVRAVAVGWEGHVREMAIALKVPEAAFADAMRTAAAHPAPAAGTATRASMPTGRRVPARVQHGPSPAVGPAPAP